MSNHNNIPNYILKIHKYFNNCFINEKRCIHCYDCIAFALLYAEDNNFKQLPSNKPYYMGENSKEWNFIKFLLSTITKKYLRCNKGLNNKIVDKYAKWLLRLKKEDKEYYRQRLLCHLEFKSNEKYKNNLKIYHGNKKGWD